jgi:hypothetical protein
MAVDAFSRCDALALLSPIDFALLFPLVQFRTAFSIVSGSVFYDVGCQTYGIVIGQVNVKRSSLCGI